MRKGVSPIIATVLLIAITVSLAFIVFSFSKGFLTQLSPSPNCESVAFVAGIYLEKDGYTLEVENNGNEPIKGFELLVADSSLGEIDVKTVNMPLEAGHSSSQNLIFETDPQGKSLVLIPIINNAKGEAKPCDSEFGKIILIK